MDAPSLPNVDPALFDRPSGARFAGAGTSAHPPCFLMLYGPLRERSYSKLLTLEAARLLRSMGGEVRISDPTGLPLPDGAPDTHPKVQELREAATWAEGMVWTSPEITITNQSSVAKAFQDFDDAGRMKPSAYYERVVDVMEELMKFTRLTRDVAPYLIDRYSERRESVAELSMRVNQRSL